MANKFNGVLVTRKARTNRIAPVNARCKLCKLYVETGDLSIEVLYGPPGIYGDQGNPLVALDRSCWICSGCLKAITEATTTIRRRS